MIQRLVFPCHFYVVVVLAYILHALALHGCYVLLSCGKVYDGVVDTLVGRKDIYDWTQAVLVQYGIVLRLSATNTYYAARHGLKRIH